jgi:hypothetical protein
MNMAHQLLLYANYAILLGKNVSHTKNTEALSDTSKQTGLEVNTEKN